MSTPKWNDIPFDSNADPQTKADEFDKQFAENQEAAPQSDTPALDNYNDGKGDGGN